MTRTAALTVPSHGAAQVLAITQRVVPEPGPGEAQIQVCAAGVNFIDVYQRQGIYPIPTPFTIGSEGAGVVVAVGRDAPVQIGQKVAWAMHLGSAAEIVNVPAAQLVPVPDGLDLRIAAAAMLQGMTAHYLVNSTYAVRPGDTALVHAAAGGVGQLLVQLITAKGARVIATAGDPHKLAIAERLGAHVTIDYRREPDLAAAVRAASAGAGVDVVYDGVGKDTFDASLHSLRPRGMLVLFGGASGQVPPFDIQRLNAAGSLYLTRPTLGSYLRDREELLWRGGEILQALADGSLHVEIGGQWPLREAAAAYQALEARATTGKLLLIP
ncbi:quinone oxidoreductase family protein [Nostocoides sp.]|uniref:quinone oxidoreductase family protein n=1 Tax=Nostocoides sp. TaxID=1917966 RepID=UPI002C2A351D|nr:quinone oxidoreductase [Tetrasphaera sp.]